VFMLLASESLREAQIDSSLLVAMAGWTISLSVLFHALSAVPLAGWYTRRLETANPDAPELLEVAGIPAGRKSLAHSRQA